MAAAVDRLPWMLITEIAKLGETLDQVLERKKHLDEIKKKLR
jgi:hypothetical protein